MSILTETTNKKYGVMGPIYVPRNADSKPVQSGKEYFYVKLHGAQAAFTGSFWEQAQQLVVTSSINLHHSMLGDEDLRAIRQVKEVKKNRAEQLGLSTNLISLIPAIMTHFTVSIEYLLDKKNRLVILASLINDESFIATVSLAPGAALAAKTIGSLAQKVITSFIPADERQPILQFTGDFNLTNDELKDGYYILLGTRDERNPIPDPLPKLEVTESGLLAGGEPVTQLSYVILDVGRSPARGRELNGGALWAKKLADAEDVAKKIGYGPAPTAQQRDEARKKCEALLQEARILMSADLNYTPKEADNIYWGAFKFCSDGVDSRARGTAAHRIVDRERLGLPEDAQIEAALDEYAEAVLEARRVISGANLKI